MNNFTKVTSFVLVLLIVFGLGSINVKASIEEDAERTLTQWNGDINITDIINTPDDEYIYMTSYDDKYLLKLNTNTGEYAFIDFEYSPERMTYHDGKLYICLVMKAHSAYWWGDEQYGQFAVVDLSDFSVQDIVDIETDPYDIAVGNNGTVYIASGSGQWTDINSYSSVDFSYLNQRRISDRSLIEYNPQLNRIYEVTTNSSPRDHHRYDLEESGEFDLDARIGDSPYHGDYRMNKYFKISPDGRFIYNGSGLILELGDDFYPDSYFSDMRYYEMLDNVYSSIVFDMDNDRFYTVYENMLSAYKYSTNEKLSDSRLAFDANYITMIDDKIVLMNNTDNKISMHKNIISLEHAIPEVTFSFDTDDAFKLMGSTPLMEYSIDNGNTYSLVDEYNYKLSDSELALINTTDDIRIRYAGSVLNPEGFNLRIDLKTGSKIKDINKLDSFNTISGITNDMEFSVNYGESWTSFNNNLPNLDGDLSLFIRQKASGEYFAGEAKEYIFRSGQNIDLTSWQVDIKVCDMVNTSKDEYIYMSEFSTRNLYRLNTNTREIDTITFEYKPERMVIHNDKLYVCLVTEGRSSYWWDYEQYGQFAVIDLSNFSVQEIVDIETDPYDIAVGNNGTVYIASGSGQWTDFISYSSVDYSVLNRESIRQASRIEYNPQLNRIYDVTSDSSPRDHNRYELEESGEFIVDNRSTGSPYHGDYRMNIYFKISPDGRFIFNGSGLILELGEDFYPDSYHKDMKYYDMLAEPFDSIIFDYDHDVFYTVSGSMQYTYQYSTLQKISEQQLDLNADYITVVDGELTYINTEDTKSIIFQHKEIPAEDKIVNTISVYGSDTIKFYPLESETQFSAVAKANIGVVNDVNLVWTVTGNKDVIIDQNGKLKIAANAQIQDFVVRVSLASNPSVYGELLVQVTSGLGNEVLNIDIYGQTVIPTSDYEVNTRLAAVAKGINGVIDAEIIWQVEGGNGITIDNTGLLTIPGGHAPTTIMVIAKWGDDHMVNNTMIIDLLDLEAQLDIKIYGTDELTIYNEESECQFNSVVSLGYEDVDADVVWSVSGHPQITINNNGLLILEGQASEGYVTVKCELLSDSSVYAEYTLNVVKAPIERVSVYGSDVIRFSGLSMETRYAGVARSVSGEQDVNLLWEVSQFDGVSINNGLLEIGSNCVANSIRVKVSLEDNPWIYDEMDVEIVRESFTE